MNASTLFLVFRPSVFISHLSDLEVTQLNSIKAWDAPHGNADSTWTTANCHNAGRVQLHNFNDYKTLSNSSVPGCALL